MLEISSGIDVFEGSDAYKNSLVHIKYVEDLPLICYNNEGTEELFKEGYTVSVTLEGGAIIIGEINSVWQDSFVVSGVSISCDIVESMRGYLYQ